MIKVLLVASNEHVRERLRLALERLESGDPADEVRFLEARNGNDALVIAEAQRPDLTVVEVGATPYGAFGLTRDLKSSPETTCPVIVVLERPQDDWLARWSGADAMVYRPVDPFALAQVARRLVEERRGVAPQLEEEAAS